jgi:hypothetical protein
VNFYMFSLSLDEVKELQKNHYSGALYTYHIGQGDYFTRIARKIVIGEKFKYMVAIRPYVISPQYLCMINNSINQIENNRLQINFISGWIKEDEKKIGGVLGNINDLSTNIERSNYLIEYIDAIEKSNLKTPDYYLSTTNEFIFNAGDRHNSKMIIPYSQYIQKRYDLNNKKIMISISPRIRETKEEIDLLKNNESKPSDEAHFTQKEFTSLIKKLESEGINEILLSSFWEEKEREYIHSFVKQYKEMENK